MPHSFLQSFFKKNGLWARPKKKPTFNLSKGGSSLKVSRLDGI
ncbi:hypothetical protein l11_04730 [Neisseria weaveri LMG 5135]|nr:hypothetical protein l11_04730 [Neisseria weaveri LMG 5135]